jgi:hypothetical protein
MPEWIFEGGKETFSIKSDDKRKLFVKSKITNFEWMSFEERLFKDREQRNRCHIMNMKVPRLTKEELHSYIVIEILYGKFTQCYKFKGWIDDEGKYTANEVVNEQKRIKSGYDPIRE